MMQARFNHLDVFQKPRCLIGNVVNGETKKRDLEINEDVLGQINEIDVPMSVVGISGAYRTGKSFLMNRLAGAGKGLKGFALGNTVSSGTKGIWVFCKVHPKHPNQVLVLLDTEGLAYDEKGDEEHDMKLFCLTMLMSSVLIYNMRGVINHDALKKLSFITEVTKMVSVSRNTSASKDEEWNCLQVISPHFVFCLRDFYYDFDESMKSADQYMESCLKESGQKNKHTNDIRGSIKGFFPKRKCFTISMPAMNNKALRNLDILSEEELREDFRTQCQNMTTYIHGLDPKVLDHVTNVHWLGKSFASILRSYIEDLSKDMKMDFEKAMLKARETHNNDLVVKYVQNFKEEIGHKLPKRRSELYDTLMESMASLLRELRKKLYPCDAERYEKKAMREMKKILDDLVSTNSDIPMQICFKYLSIEYDEMMEGNKERYENDYTLYEKDYAQLLKDYKIKFHVFNEELHAALKMFEESSKVLTGTADTKLKSELKKMADEYKIREKDILARVERQRQEIKEEQQRQKEEYESRLRQYDDENKKREKDIQERAELVRLKQQEDYENKLKKYADENKIREKDILARVERQRKEIKHEQQRQKEEYENRLKEYVEEIEKRETDIQVLLERHRDDIKKEQEATIESYKDQLQNYEVKLTNLLSQFKSICVILILIIIIMILVQFKSLYVALSLIIIIWIYVCTL